MTATNPPATTRFTTPAPGVVRIEIEYPDGTTFGQTISIFEEMNFDVDTGQVQATVSGAARHLILARRTGDLSELLADRLFEQLLGMFPNHPKDETI